MGPDIWIINCSMHCFIPSMLTRVVHFSYYNHYKHKFFFTYLREVDNSSLTIAPSQCAKTLGVHWNTQTDTLHVFTPSLSHLKVPTKREVASAVGKTFDVLGWFSPSTIQIKILLQNLWKQKIGWDEALPPALLPVWNKWKDELSLLTDHPIPRRFSKHDSPVCDRQLHGFSDSSQSAYGGVVYLRTLHKNATVTVSLVSSKTKVAPLTGSTIPRLELGGALILSRLLIVTARDLNIPDSHIYAWCDSSAVLGWIKISPSRLKSYVANRVQKLISLIPPDQCSTSHNPADHASRGLSPGQLISCDLWWNGPYWLKLSAEDWPRRLDIDRPKALPELKATVLTIKQSPPTFDLCNRYSSFQRLLTVTAWCRRFWINCHGKNFIQESRLTDEELAATKTCLLHLSQITSYSAELEHLLNGKPELITSISTSTLG